LLLTWCYHKGFSTFFRNICSIVFLFDLSRMLGIPACSVLGAFNLKNSFVIARLWMSDEEPPKVQQQAFIL